MNETLINQTVQEEPIIDYLFDFLGVQTQFSGYEGIAVFIGILLASVVAAKVMHWIIERYIKSIASKTRSDIDDLIIKIIQKPLYYIILLIGVELGVRIIDLPAELHSIISAILSAAIIAVGAWLMAGLIDTVLINVIGKRIAAKTKTTADDEAIPFLSKVIKVVIYILAFIIILDQFAIEITPLVASLGIAGFALGFAAQDSIKNILAGFFILIDRPFSKGDRIEIKGNLGEVIDIGLRTTRIETLDHTYVIIPNGDIIANELTNYALPNVQLKVKMNFGVAYGTDPKKVKEILLRIAHETEEVLDDPASNVYFTEFGDSALNFLLVVWVPNFRRKFEVMDEINTKVDAEFKKAGIEIPFPCRTVYLRKE